VYLARNWPFGVHLLMQQAEKAQIKAYPGWQGPVQEAHALGGEMIGIPKGGTASRAGSRVHAVFDVEAGPGVPGLGPWLALLS
jgi:hypothetical protein